MQNQELLVQKTELAKKMKSCDSSEDETNSEDDNSPSESDFELFSYNYLSSIYQQHKFYSGTVHYSFLQESVNTPPPKI